MRLMQTSLRQLIKICKLWNHWQLIHLLFKLENSPAMLISNMLGIRVAILDLLMLFTIQQVNSKLLLMMH